MVRWRDLQWFLLPDVARMYVTTELLLSSNKNVEAIFKGPRRTGPAYLDTRRGGEGRARRYHECGRTTHPNEAKASLGMSPVDILEKEPERP